MLSSLILGALVLIIGPLIGPRIEGDVEHALCTILRIEPCPAAVPPQAQAPPQPTPDTVESRCVTNQDLSYYEVTGYVRPRIVGGRGNLRWTTYIRTLAHGPGRPDTYEVTLQDWKEGSVEAGLEKGEGGKLPTDVMGYLGLNATEGKVFTFNSKADAEAFQKQIPRYFIGGTAYDATTQASGPVGTALGAIDNLTGGHIRKWAQGDPPKPWQEYHEAGPTAGVELGVDIPLGGGGNKISLSGRGRFYRLYGENTNNSTGGKSYYLRQNNRLQPSVTISLAGLSGMTTADGAESAIQKAVLARTGQSVGVPADIVQYVIKYGSAGLSLKWRYNTQYQVTTDKNNNMTRVTKVTDTNLTWYAQGNIKGPSIGADDPGAQGMVSLAATRDTETDAFDLKTPEDKKTALDGMKDILLQNYFNPITPPKDNGLERAFDDRGVKTRLHFDNNVKNGKLLGRNYTDRDYGVKGVVGVELNGEDEQGHLAGAQYWDPSTASWKDWTKCR